MNGIENFPLKEKPTIENHDWCDPNIDTLNAEPTFNRERIVVTSDEYSYKIYKDDAIAIARHFYEKLSTHERLEYINSIRGVSNA